METTFPAWGTMLFIDVLMIAVALAATCFLVVQRGALAHARAWPGAFAIMAGLWLLAGLYIADFYVMVVLPGKVGMAAAMHTMHILHERYSWYLSASAAVLLLAGLAVTIRRLIDHSQAAMRDRKAAQISEQRLRTMFLSEPECVKTVDREGRLLDMNPAGLDMIEVDDLDAVRGQSVLDLIAPKYRGTFQQSVDQVFAGEHTHHRFEIIGLRGTRRWMEQVAVPLMAPDGSGEIVEMLAVTRDVSDQVAAMEELSVQKQKAETANNAKTRFLANMSHEIRTPLNGILGMAQVLARKDLGEPYNDYVGTILESGDALLTIVNDVLDVAKIEAQRLELIPHDTDLRACLSSTVALWQPMAQKKQLGLRLSIAEDVPPSLMLDDVRVRQCVSNLISNAIKFTDKGGITVEVCTEPADAAPGAERKAGTRVIIRVADNGIGISDEDQTRLFRAFEQADDSSSRAYGGTGLGLTISRKLAQLMGGDLTVSSTLGAGATFTLTVHAAAPDEAANSPQALAAGA